MEISIRGIRPWVPQLSAWRKILGNVPGQFFLKNPGAKRVGCHWVPQCWWRCLEAPNAEEKGEIWCWGFGGVHVLPNCSDCEVLGLWWHLHIILPSPQCRGEAPAWSTGVLPRVIGI